MFTKNKVLKIAKLSYIDVSNDELKDYIEEFNRILSYFEIINNIDLSEKINEETLLFPIDGREDIVRDSSIKINELTSFTEENFFKIPKVIDKSN